MGYDELAAWSRCIDLVRNRAKVINSIVGCSSGYAADLCYSRGRYRLRFLGHEVASAKVYDLQQARDLLSFTEGVRSCCWGLSRDGFADFLSDNQHSQ